MRRVALLLLFLSTIALGCGSDDSTLSIPSSEQVAHGYVPADLLPLKCKRYKSEHNKLAARLDCGSPDKKPKKHPCARTDQRVGPVGGPTPLFGPDGNKVGTLQMIKSSDRGTCRTGVWPRVHGLKTNDTVVVMMTRSSLANVTYYSGRPGEKGVIFGDALSASPGRVRALAQIKVGDRYGPVAVTSYYSGG